MRTRMVNKLELNSGMRRTETEVNQTLNMTVHPLPSRGVLAL